MVFDCDKDLVYKWLEEYYPEHIGGYQNGWLDINKIKISGHMFYQVYSGGKFLGTVLEW